MLFEIFLTSAVLVGLSASYLTNCLMRDDMMKCMKERLHENGMDRVLLLKDQQTTCNDGTPAGYYVHQNPASSEWVIYLEGGLFCPDPQSCLDRMNQPSVSSSRYWGTKRLGDGLLSLDKAQNSEFWQANHVYVPYCSSDFWVGNAIQELVMNDDSISTKSYTKKIAFHGSRIISGVIKDLLNTTMLKDADKVIMAGSSAGGIGVLQNIDHVTTLLTTHGNKKTDVRGLVDSAWFLDCENCNPNTVFKQAIKYWNAALHPKCSSSGLFEAQQHKCLFASNTFKFVQRPIFVFQWLLDTVQIMSENVQLMSESKELSLDSTYAKNLGRRMRKSLRKVDKKHGIFAVSCISHTGLATTSPLYSITLKDLTLNHALQCWLGTTKSTKCRHRLLDSCIGLDCHKNKCPLVYDPTTGLEIKPPKIPDPWADLENDSARYYLELLSGLQVLESDKNQGKV